MKKNRFLIGMALGMALTFAGLLLSLAGYNASFMVVAGVTAIVLASVIRWRTGHQPESDERSLKIWAFCAGYSWLVSLLFVATLLGGGYLGILTMSAQQALEMIGWVMSLSAVLFMAYFRYKGDVEGA
jgi:hypothetical protein